MESKIKIIFHSSAFRITINALADITVKELITKFLSNYRLDLNEVKQDLSFLYKGEKLYSKMDRKLSSLGLKEKPVILVMDRKNLINPDMTVLENEINTSLIERRNQKEKEIKFDTRFLEEMAVYGYIQKGKIEEEYIQHPENFIKIDEAIRSKRENESLFILGLLGKYLELLRINVYIEVKESHSNQLANNNVLQYLVNGLMTKKKYYLTFEGNIDDIGRFTDDKNFRNNFIDKLKNKLSNIYNVNKNEILVTYIPKKGIFKLIIIFLNRQDIVLNLKDLKIFYKEQNLNVLAWLGESSLIDAIKLNKSMLDSYGNRKKEEWQPFNYDTKGKEIYYPPIGWDRYGLNVWNQYDNGNNDWLAYDNRDGEWCIAYYTVMNMEKNNKINAQYENDDDENHPNEKVGRGTYVTQYPKKLEEDAIKINDYQIGFMVRVKPDLIRKPSNCNYYWVVNGSPDEIRPSGILIKN